MLEHALDILHHQAEYIFIKIKSLCPKDISYGALSSLLDFLDAVLNVKVALQMWGENDPTKAELLEEYFMVSFVCKTSVVQYQVLSHELEIQLWFG